MQKIKVPLNVKTEVSLNGDTTNFSLHTNKKALDLSTILFAVVTLEKSESQVNIGGIFVFSFTADGAPCRTAEKR